ncbi:phosphoadenosine phosphosulfate reductase domain-containing protein [Acidovorax sp. BL-A-41-H1]|uniref:phosphoadenosine phosphosulfate reductase domain-containing protein n=1 Tax=Acidovorax sp. BL-A-41-H1 TaxID=3421102 RepID=UPI003F78CF88
MEHNIISVSGGKDSTALLLLAIEREAENMQAVFADTGHEHPQTLEYVHYLSDWMVGRGLPAIRWVKADFAKDIARKAEFVLNHWKSGLMAGQPGEWSWWPAENDGDDACAQPVNRLTGQPVDEPPTPENPYLSAIVPRGTGRWFWAPAVRAMSDSEADAKIHAAREVLVPTGIPFLDLCIWKGRFASTRARFCSEELKHVPITEQVQLPLLESGADVMSWQGVRADESLARRHLTELEAKRTLPNGATLWNYRPILQWTADDCFAMHRKHGVKHNPLYEQGMGRVGCMPCIHARKDELLAISQRFPQEVERVAEWERIVSIASKRGCSTFFEADTISGNPRDMAAIHHETHGITSVIEWAKTSRGGRQFDFFRSQDAGPSCSSIYGLCE